jgi:hypothetical protein
MRGRRTIVVGAAAALIAGGVIVGQPLSARAANSYSVITNLDAAPGTCAALMVGTLRDCINAADSAPGTNTISFAPTVTAPIVLSMGELDITGSQTLTIAGSGQSATVIDGNAASRVFSVSSGATVTMTDLTVQNGKFTHTGALDGGGGIRSAGTLSLTRVTMSGNQSVGTPGSGASGGAIFFSSTDNLNIVSSTFSANTASSDTDSDGGAFQDCCSGAAHIVITNSTFNGNTATSTTGQAFGGAIDSHSFLTINGTTFSGNIASQTSSVSGGGVGASAINTHGVLTIDGSTFHSNVTTAAAPNRGGGGAILVCCGGGTPSITLTHSTFDHNTVNGPSNPHAGALQVCCGATGSIATSTFFSNSVSGSDSVGGAVEIDTSAGVAGVPITNSTFSSNSASGARSRGGGIYLGFISMPSPAVALVNDTIDGNSAGTGANLFVSRDTNATALNTIISGTPASNCVVEAGATLTDNGHNLDDAATSTCGFTAAKGDVLGSNPDLNEVADNGGPTQTQELRSGSPAIDTGTNNGCPATDQRGFTRITSADPTCDIGAFEVQAATTPVTPPGPLPPAGAGLPGPLAALLILGGLGALALVRRRRR